MASVGSALALVLVFQLCICEEYPDIVMTARLDDNETLSISCTVKHHDPSQIKRIAIGATRGSDTTIGEVTHTNRIENRFQSPYRHRPVHVFGQLSKSASSPAYLTVQLNVTKCHRGKYWCDVGLVTMEQFSWSGIKTERADKEVVVCKKKPNVFIQEKLHKNGSLTISCVVNQSGSPSPLRNIIMGTGITTLAKFKAEERPSYSYSRRQEYRPVQRGEVYSNRSLVSFVSVQFNNSECHYGRYWCDVTFPDMERFSWSLPALPRVLKEIRTCDGAINMVLDKPDFADPAHFRLTCDISPNVTSISNITFMQIRRVQKNHKTEVIAYANTSAHYGTVAENASFTRKGMIISGSIDQSESRNSMLQIESWICEHAGSYVCDVFYTAPNQPKFTMAEIRVDNPCGSVPKISLTDQTKDGIIFSRADPTSFSVICTGDTHTRHRDTPTEVQTVSLQLSVLQDETFQRKQIATFNVVNGGLPKPKPKLQSNYKGRGFRIRKPESRNSYNPDPAMTVSTNAGTCRDTGVYRCTMLYWTFPSKVQASALRVAIAEARKPPCVTGALIQHKVHRRARHQDHLFSFTCSANATLVSELISLEISRVGNRSRKVLAVAIGYLNKGQASKQCRGRFSVRGHVDVRNATASFLTITTRVPREDYSRGVSLVTTCRAAFVGLDAGQKMVEAISDGIMEYLH